MKKLAALVLAIFCVLGLFACKSNNQDERELIPLSSVATFEYKEDNGYKLITSEIFSLDTFNSLTLKQSETEFDGEWVYRIVFNPQKYSKNTEEFIVLFGEECVSVNGVTYIADDNVSYSDILSWAEAKYKFFDYDWKCGSNPRASSCLMTSSRFSISNDDVICPQCICDIRTYLIANGFAQ